MLNGQKRLGLKPTLVNYLKRYSGVPYQYGYHDCFVFCLRWADLNNNTNLKDLYAYKNKPEGMDLIKLHNKNNIFDLFDNHFNRTDAPKVGDLVAWGENQYGACGIMSENNYSTVSVLGGVSESSDAIFRAWSI